MVNEYRSVGTFLWLLLTAPLASVYGIDGIQGAMSAADRGSVQVSEASPNPSRAGESVTLQAVIINQGQFRWERGKYYIDAEIYDSTGNYLCSLGKTRGKNDVDINETLVYYNEFNVPASFYGSYRYRLFVYHNDVRVVESDYFGFEVLNITGEIFKPVNYGINGNMALSFYSLHGSSDNYVGNLDINLTGETFNNPAVFRLSAYKAQDYLYGKPGGENRIFNVYYSNFGSFYNVSAGDIRPEFSRLSLHGNAMRGVMAGLNIQNFFFNLAGGQEVMPEAANGNYTGINQKVLAGGNIKYLFSGDIFAAVNYVAVNDSADSRIKNNVFSGEFDAKTESGIGFNIEYANSAYAGHISSGTLIDDALGVEVRYITEDSISKIIFEETAPNYFAFGSPSLRNNRRTIGFISDISRFKNLDFNLRYEKKSDNTDDSNSMATNIQQLYSADARYYLVNTKTMSMTCGLFYDEAFSSDRNYLDNYTDGMKLGFNGEFNRMLLSVNTQLTDFKDNRSILDNYTIHAGGFTFSLPFTIASVNFGGNVSEIHNYSKGIIDAIGLISANMTYVINPKLASMQLLINNSTDKNNLLSQGRIDRNEIKSGCEFAFKLNDDTDWFIGISYNVINDYAMRNSVSERGFSTRLILNFLK